MSKGTHASLPVPEPVVRERLVPVYLSPDSALLSALFECDSTGRVLMRQVEELKGRTMGTDLSFTDGRLDYTARTVPDTVYLPGRDSIIYVPQEVVVETEVNRLTWWQETWIYIGKALAALVAAVAGFTMIRKWIFKK